MKADIDIARVYDGPFAAGRARLLVDRIWPRGMAKATLAPDEWIPEVAPSTALCKWFGHDPARWDEFRRRYLAELAGNAAAVERCLAWRRRGPVTLLYSARDRAHNQALVLRDHLTDQFQAGKDRP
jgi:uncharacterized protein YeaO (DUF488 family)